MKHGNLTKKVFYRTMLSMAITEISFTLATTIDGFTASRFLGHEAMAAMGLASMVGTLLALVGGLLGTGAQSICGKKLAEADTASANRIFNLVFWSSMGAGMLIMLAVLLLPEQIAYCLGARESMGNVWLETTNYLRGLAWSMPATVMKVALVSFIHLDGARKRCSVGIIAFMVTDIVLDFAAVLVFHSGMFGLGMATSIAGWIEVSILFQHFTKKDVVFKPVLHLPDFTLLRPILLSGVPVAVQRGANIVRKLLLNLIIGALASGYGLAALSVQNNVKDFGDALGVGIGQTMLLLAGISFGERNKQEVKNLFGTGLSSLKFSVLLAVLLAAAAPLIARVYSTDPLAISYTTFAVVCCAVSVPLVAFNTMYIKYLQGSGRIKQANFVILMQRCVCIVPLAWVLSKVMGFRGVFIAFPLSELLVICTVFLYVQIKARSRKFSLDNLLLLPDDFGNCEAQQISCTISNLEELTRLSQQVQAFCIQHHVLQKNALYLALFVEEIGSNIMLHGFREDKHNSIDFHLACHEDGSCTISFRDDCDKFDPKAYYEFMNTYQNDKMRNIGLRIVFGLAKEIKYVNTLRMNILLITL